MLLTDAVMVLWGNREKPRAVNDFLFPQWAQSFAASNMWDRLICADDIPEGAPDTDIVVSEGFVSNDNTGGEGSGLGDVWNEVIADDDVA